MSEQCITWLEEDKSVVEWFGKCETSPVRLNFRIPSHNCVTLIFAPAVPQSPNICSAGMCNCGSTSSIPMESFYIFWVRECMTAGAIVIYPLYQRYLFPNVFVTFFFFIPSWTATMLSSAVSKPKPELIGFNFVN